MPPRLAELVGRAMIDPGFLAELRRVPDEVLAGFELSESERETVRRALARGAKASPREQMDELKDALLRRVAT